MGAVATRRGVGAPRTSSLRKQGPIRRGPSFWHANRRPSHSPTSCGYGSLLSQGRQLGLQPSLRVQANNPSRRARKDGLLRRGACHRARVRATRWLLAMTWIQFRVLAARRTRGLPIIPALETKGAGNAGRSLRPQPCVQMKKAHKCRHHGHIGFTRHSPRNGFNKLPRALPGDQELFATVTGGIGVSGPTGPTSPSAGLTPTSRRQDHTSSPSASTPFVKGASASTASRRQRP
jgi:hypothetical protein